MTANDAPRINRFMSERFPHSGQWLSLKKEERELLSLYKWKRNTARIGSTT
jgi:hypothetical protein